MSRRQNFKRWHTVEYCKNLYVPRYLYLVLLHYSYIYFRLFLTILLFSRLELGLTLELLFYMPTLNKLTTIIVIIAMPILNMSKKHPLE